MLEKRQLTPLLWFALVACSLRMLLVWFTRHDPVFSVPYLDGAYYHVWAQALAAERGHFQGPYFLGPLYPHLLAWLYSMFGADPMVVRVLQSLLGVLSSLFLVVLGRRLFGSLCGFVAGGLFLGYGTFAFYEGLIVLEPLFTTLTLAVCLLLTVNAKNKSLFYVAGLAGLLLGLAALTRGTALLLVPLAILVLRKKSANWAPALACLLTCALVLSPVLIRNARQGGGLVLTTNAGVNFFAGNNEAANGRFHNPPGVGFFKHSLMDANVADMKDESMKRLLSVTGVAGTPRAADSRYWFAKAFDWIQAQPLDFCLLIMRKFGLTLQSREIPQIESFAYHRSRLLPLRLMFINLTLLLPLAALGVWLVRRHRLRNGWIPVGFMLCMLSTCVLFFVTARYRLAAAPYFCLFASLGVTQLVSWWRAGSRRKVLVATAVLVALGFATRLGGQPPTKIQGWQSAQMAERVYAMGDLTAAIGFQEVAARLLPARYEVALNLALYWSERESPGDVAHAQEILVSLLRQRPKDPILHYNLGSLFEQQGKDSAAKRAYSAALKLDPAFDLAGQGLSRLQSKVRSPRLRNSR